MTAQVAGTDQENAAFLVEDEATGGEFEQHTRAALRHAPIIPATPRVIPFVHA